ncbi:putative non-specific serine/threonine protein kinase [Helianthus annuus]|uniref:Non-specific serine/threonine protein kinase n=1 Tax=Helianthus annuus TaxID=4232 RepID=A0A9K3HMP5_HELAN|nr:putative non-specific serine/threonine protein kinase [Helianthus annuus]KAJ0508547.1 putative non-specific serine/threonine protein kinase [Helianthus annuus]KAJ0688730.1 putative non-specific serine/threonine protein kinase [Helianthus annuus]KAJ0869934.1 putative non-specific serine/threonine protein kinase [Helianthus annuus]
MVSDTLMEDTRVTKTRLICGFLVVYAPIICIYAADSTLSANQPIRYNETIVSPQETFELGFFSPGNSMNHYVGIWYKKISKQTVVWVANRNAPLTHTSGELTLTLLGVLTIRDATTGNILWSSVKSSRTSVMNPIGQLLDTGNFIIYEQGDQENPIWQSFDFLTDTFLPGMKYGKNLVTGFESHLTSWKSDDDPASGNFSYGIDTRGYPQVILMDGPDIKSRIGPWNGLRYTGFPNMRPNTIYNYTFVLNQREIYYENYLINTSVLMRLVLHPNGLLNRLFWNDGKQNWTVYWAPINDQCDWYAVCGPFGTCNIDNTPICECLKGFKPRSPDQWRGADPSQGCQRAIPLDCGPGEGFNKYSNLKLPDTKASWYNQTMTLVDCEKMCKSNCSCTAYTNSNISGAGSGCLLWFGDLIDIRMFSENGDTLYIRMPPSELDNRNSSSATENRKSSNEGIRVQVMVLIAFLVFFILVSICLVYRFNRKKQYQQGMPQNEFELDHENRSGNEDLELPHFGLSALLKATNNFSMNNKLGEGGYGPVYKVFHDSLTFCVVNMVFMLVVLHLSSHFRLD